MGKRGQRTMSKWKNPRPKCPTCHYAMRNVLMRNANHTIKLGYFCSECNLIKLKPGIKLIHDPIFIGLNNWPKE